MHRLPKLLFVTAVIAGGASLSGCATKSYVDEQIAAVNMHIDSVDARAQDGIRRADAAARAKPAREIPSLEPGDRVLHDSSGLGTVVALEGAEDKTVASIDFGSEGVKRLLLRYAPVEKL